MLKFDTFGNSYFEELSRMDVLRMTEEAAKEKESENECVHVVPMATSVSPRAKSRTFPHPQRSSNADRMDTALHAGICDVQVRQTSGEKIDCCLILVVAGSCERYPQAE